MDKDLLLFFSDHKAALNLNRLNIDSLDLLGWSPDPDLSSFVLSCKWTANQELFLQILPWSLCYHLAIT